MLNRVVLVGRLTKDPDLRYTENGNAVANFTVAVNRPFSNQQGEREVDFINCVIWRKQAEALANYTSKGSLIGVDGRIQTRSYDNQEGKRVFITEILAEAVQFLEFKNNKEKEPQNDQRSVGYQDRQYQNQQPASNQSQYVNQKKPIDISDDDLPF